MGKTLEKNLIIVIAFELVKHKSQFWLFDEKL